MGCVNMPDVIEESRSCGKCTWEELNEKFAAKCKAYDELVKEKKKVDDEMSTLKELWITTKMEWVNMMKERDQAKEELAKALLSMEKLEEKCPANDGEPSKSYDMYLETTSGERLAYVTSYSCKKGADSKDGVNIYNIECRMVYLTEYGIMNISYLNSQFNFVINKQDGTTIVYKGCRFDDEKPIAYGKSLYIWSMQREEYIAPTDKEQ